MEVDTEMFEVKDDLAEQLIKQEPNEEMTDPLECDYSETYNPWNVPNVTEFLYFCCPECDLNFRQQNKDSFLQHANQHHPKSHEYLIQFGMKVKAAIVISVKRSENKIQPETKYKPRKEENQEVDEEKEDGVFDDALEEGSIPNEEETPEVVLEKGVFHDNPEEKYQCDSCVKSFGVKNTFIGHYKRLHGKYPKFKKNKEKKFWCDPCDKGYSSLKCFETHNKTYHKIPPLEPEVIKQEDGTLAYYCGYCDKTMHSTIEWTEHIEKAHPKPKTNKRIDPETGKTRFYCEKCDFWIDGKDSFRTHRKAHEKCTKPGNENCLICNATFDHLCFLVRHMKEKHSVDGHYKCPLCPKLFEIGKKRSKSNLEFHMAKSHDVGTIVKDRMVQCDLCGKEMANKFALKKHMRVVHEKIWDKVICDICGKVSKSKSDLQWHHQYYHAQYEVKEQDLKKKCEKCLEEFNDPEVFNEHLKTCLDELKDFKCSDCDLHWVSHLSLELHLTVSHKKVNFACRLCGKTFTTQSRLEGHIKQIHEKSNRVVCHLCAQSCFNQSYYQKHLAVKHGIGELKHKCDHCELKFFHENDLKIHVNVKHTQDTIYNCKKCSKTFLTKSASQNHFRIAHMLVNKCDVCSITYYNKRDLIKHKANSHH